MSGGTMQNSDNVEKIDLDKIDWWSSREFFESLGEELDKLDDKDESYNFTWVGKRKSIIETGAPINKTLRPDMDASKDFDNTKNMLIVGDNLDALKLLQESYLGIIKMIYIDPPYNTGHDFVYHDNFTIKKEKYNDGTTDEDGNVILSEDEYIENAKTNGRFHSDWLSMMYPRLRLARNLLREDGVIFISISDDEYASLRKLCDEIYGEDNYIGTLIRKTKMTSNKGTFYSQSHEYILTYAKSIADTPMFNDSEAQQSEEYTKLFRYEDERGRYNIVSLYMPSLPNADERPNSRYGIKAPDGTVVFPPKNKIFRWKEDSYLQNLTDNRVVFKETKTSPLIDENGNRSKWNIYTKLYLHERQAAGILPITLIDKYTNSEASKELIKMDIPFDFSKPKSLIKYLLKIIGSKEDDVVLDFFAGSGTTGHAVMDLNAEDGGNRKYILVQLDEPTDEKSEAKKAGYDTIDQITAERLRRAGDKIIKEHPDLEGKLDTGFRVFHIDSANEREDVRKSVYDTKQEDMFGSIDNIKHDRTPLDLLFGTIIYMALPLDLKLEVKNINNNTIYFYGYQDEGMGLIACFDDSISDDTVKEIAKLKPLTAVFKDSSFKDSAAKINLSEIFRTISNETRMKVI